MLWALALESLSPGLRDELISLVQEDDGTLPEKRIQRVRQLYHEAGVFEQAHRLVDKHQQRAEAIVGEIECEELQRLLHFLIDTILERPAESVESGPAVELELSAPGAWK